MVSKSPIIALDCDDTLAMTNAAIIDLHNEMYPNDAIPPLTLDDLTAYHYWKTRGWGDVKQTMAKVKAIYATGKLAHVDPVSGAIEACQELARRGYELVIVTARSIEVQAETEAWVEKHFGSDTISRIIFTGAFTHFTDATAPEKHKEHIGEDTTDAPTHVSTEHHDAVRIASTAMKKSEVVRKIGAIALVDDSIENALECATEDIPVLLFGPLKATHIPVPHWPWSLRPSTLTRPEDFLSYQERIDRGIVPPPRPADSDVPEKDVWGEDIELPKNITRVMNWEEVLSHYPPL